MNEKEWQELEELSRVDKMEGERFKELLNKTEDEEEHPEIYDGACLCRLCCSYGD